MKVTWVMIWVMAWVFLAVGCNASGELGGGAHQLVDETQPTEMPSEESDGGYETDDVSREVDVEALDSTASYIVSWSPNGDPGGVEERVDQITDIREFFDLEDEGVLVVEEMVQVDPDVSVIVMSDELAQRTTGRSCSAATSTKSYTTSGAPGSFWVKLDIAPNSKSTLYYSPSCSAYPCTRTMKGTNWLSATFTDHYWRSGSGSWSYFGSSNTTPFWWNRSYYSGSSSISYMAEVCSCYVPPTLGNPGYCNATGLSVRYQ